MLLQQKSGKLLLELSVEKREINAQLLGCSCQNKDLQYK